MHRIFSKRLFSSVLGAIWPSLTLSPVSTSQASERQPATKVAVDRAGFTLIEMLVVISIIGTLLAITIPAVQAARESARLAACRNKVAQIAKGLANLESAMQAYPSGGWGDEWLGSPERGTETRQPGGWIFALLPYIEEKQLYLTVEGATAGTAEATYRKLTSASLPMFACPSRRRSRALPVSAAGNDKYKTVAKDPTEISINEATRTDYTANGGSSPLCPSLSTLSRLATAGDRNTKVPFCHVSQGSSGSGGSSGNGQGPPSLPLASIISGGHAGHAGDHFGQCGACDGEVDPANPSPVSTGDDWTKKQTLADKLGRPDGGMPELQDGVFYRMSRVKVASIRDGLSNTYLVGEKYMTSNNYTTGSDKGDDRPLFVGYSDGTIRWARLPPARDTGSTENPTAFGSAHRSGWTVALADGSVRTVDFTIDPNVHKQLSSRSDGQLLPSW